MPTGSTQKNTYPFIALILSLGLVFSFGLHAVQIEHAHFGDVHAHGGEHQSVFSDLGEYMHLADKKMLLILSSGTLLWIFLLHIDAWSRLLQYVHTYSLRYRQRRFQVYRALGYLSRFFGEGLLHSKVH